VIYDFETKTTSAAELPENWRESYIDIHDQIMEKAMARSRAANPQA
jgi:hypothetical protein